MPLTLAEMILSIIKISSHNVPIHKAAPGAPPGISHSTLPAENGGASSGKCRLKTEKGQKAVLFTKTPLILFSII